MASHIPHLLESVQKVERKIETWVQVRGKERVLKRMRYNPKAGYQ